MKSTKVYSDSTLKDSRVTWQTDIHTHQDRNHIRRDKQTGRKKTNRWPDSKGVSERDTDVRGDDTYMNIQDDIRYQYRRYDIGEVGVLTVPELMYFFFLLFFLGFKT